MLHGAPGDGNGLGAKARSIYAEDVRQNTRAVVPRLRAGDVVVLHDPQTAGLAPALRKAGAAVVWRCHVGADAGNEHTEAAWRFLRPYIDSVYAFIFTRRAYVPDWIGLERVHIVPPSIDPFSAKNIDLPRDHARSILREIGLVHDLHPSRGAPRRRTPASEPVHPDAVIVHERPVPSFCT
jgi:trehalose synthase